MESGLGSLLELFLLFFKLRDKKSYRWSQSVCIWYASIYLFCASMFPFAGHKKDLRRVRNLYLALASLPSFSL